MKPSLIGTGPVVRRTSACSPHSRVMASEYPSEALRVYASPFGRLSRAASALPAGPVRQLMQTLHDIYCGDAD